MFLHSSVFSEAGFAPDTADLAAKIANQWIDQAGLVVWGEHLQNGECHNFGTTKGDIDSHVAVIIGLSLMGGYKPHSSPIQLERPSKQDIERLQADRIKQLEADNRMLRGKK